MRSLVSLILLCADAARDNYEPQCSSDNDYGWPRFHSVSELQASPWSSYFFEVYGGLPSKFPVCIYDFRTLNKDAYLKANITGHKLVPIADVEEGDLFEEAGLSEKEYMIYHERYEPLPDNTWVEITHTAYPTELSGYWVFRLRGTGVWYNIGKTIVFPTPAEQNKVHQEAIAFLTHNCSKKPSKMWPQLESDIFGFCAREKGYDSIQFEPQAGQKKTGFFGITGVTEMLLVNIDGKYNCGVADASATPLRAGWMASKQCTCENYEIPDSCGLMARPPFPFSVVGTSPPLCKSQSGHFWNRWRSCDPTTCKPTKCTPKKYSVGSSRATTRVASDGILAV